MSDISRSAGAHHGLKLRLNALIGFFLPMAEGHKITHVLSFSPLQFNLERESGKGEMQSNPVFKWQLRNGAQVKILRQCDLSGRAIVILTTRSEKAGIGEELHFQAFNRHVSTTKPLLLRKKLIFRGQ